MNSSEGSERSLSRFESQLFGWGLDILFSRSYFGPLGSYSKTKMRAWKGIGVLLIPCPKGCKCRTSAFCCFILLNLVSLLGPESWASEEGSPTCSSLKMSTALKHFCLAWNFLHGNWLAVLPGLLPPPSIKMNYCTIFLQPQLVQMVLHSNMFGAVSCGAAFVHLALYSLWLALATVGH